MANKILTTRLKLKYDTLANWSKTDVADKGGNLVLLAGEIGIVSVPTGSSAEQTTPPAILMKVGDGTTAFKDLPWTSAKAADVYAWAKAATKPSYNWSEIGDKPTIPTVGNGKITITQNGKEMGSFTVNQSGSATIELKDTNTDTNTSYQLVLSGHTLKLQSKEKGASTWTDVTGQSFTLPDNNTTYTFATGSTNGTISVTPSGGSATDVKVKGLAALAYKASLGKGDVGLGNVENKTLDTSVTASSGNYITSGAVKTYVDNAIGGVKQFRYEVVTELPTASAATMGKIYLKAHSHNPSDGQPDSYDEFITLEEGTATKTYKWERIGNTDINLSNYYTKAEVNTELGKKQNNLNTNQLAAANSGITSTKVTTYDGYASKISTLEGKPGLDKVGTVTSVSGADGLTGSVTSTGSLKANLNSYAKNTAAIGGKLYAVELDKNGKLAVNVPWVDTNTQRTDTEIKNIINTYPGVNKTGTVTSVQIKGSTYVKVDNEAAITTSGTRTISLSDKVLTTDDVLIFDCGSSTVNI